MTPSTARSGRLAVFTICSNNYLPFAHVLFRSVRRHHPEAALFLCLADRRSETPDLYDRDWTVVEAHELPIPDFPSFAFRYDIMEFNTALKPFMFLHLLDDRDFDEVIYFDPDIEVFASLTTVLAALQGGAPFFLTPHLLSPSENRQEPNDITIIRAGTYNLGFLGVSRSKVSAELLGWWARRLRYDCVDAQAKGLFVDQKFMELMPSFAPGTVISHDGTLNVAYWNIKQRVLAETGEGWTVDGAPLTFFHFSGFDPRMPNRLSKHDPRFAVALPSPLGKFTMQYAERLLAAGYGAVLGAPYAYGRFASGTLIHPAIRRMFRDWHPYWGADPFESYEAFLHEAWHEASRGVPRYTVTNFMRFLQGLTPRLGGLDLRLPEDAARLVCWFVDDAAEELQLDPALVEPAAERLGRLRPPLIAIPSREVGREIDLALTAPLRSGGEPAQIARRSFPALLTSGRAIEMLDAAAPATGDRAPVQIICLEGAAMSVALPAWAAQLRSDAYRILIPIWDLPRFPDDALAAMELVHEVWAPSRFLQCALAGHTDRPVIHMPVAVEAEAVEAAPRSRFGLPEDRFLFLSLFDPRPDMAHADPRLAIRAFRRAFPQAGAACLVLAGRDGRASFDQRAALEREIDGDPDIRVLDREWTPVGLLSLMASCDAVLSLHRSLGLGLFIAEAMLLTRPVIATGYAASRAFVTEETGYPVDYRLVPAEDDDPPLHWAEPDLGHAAWLMRRLWEEPGRAAPQLALAQAHILQHYSRDAVGALQRARLHELGMP